MRVKIFENIEGSEPFSENDMKAMVAKSKRHEAMDFKIPLVRDFNADKLIGHVTNLKYEGNAIYADIDVEIDQEKERVVCSIFPKRNSINACKVETITQEI